MIKQRKVFQRFTTVCLTLIGLLAVLTSCNNDDEKLYDVTHKVVYKAEGSAGVNITSVVYSQGGYKPITNVNGSTWTSAEFTETKKLAVGRIDYSPVLVAVDATGTSASSTLKVQIYVDGVLKKEVKTSGQVLTADADYSIEYKVN